MQTSLENVGTASGKGELEQFLPDYLKDSLGKLDYPIPIPICWNVNDCSPDLKIDDNLLSVRYNGNRIAAAVRANYWIPEETEVYYFEVDILDGGVGDLISVGVATQDFTLARHVGYACSFDGEPENLYPAIGMRSRNARVEANFGNRPFKFDIKLYIETLSQQDLNSQHSQQDFIKYLNSLIE
ncbi:37827_t:CDS:2 [Gigaspora margarita]|uniref:37827_t:CDS:1 n=1 Tax=Gigaspora margarita TaxID=4874 RepID=A0ABM8W196_GIGMA|nr:37827_t:CDS:2 [Gigaspora margarita]